MSPRWNWDSPTPLAASECAHCPPPVPKGGGAHSPAAKGGGVLIPTTGETLSTLPTLCIIETEKWILVCCRMVEL